MPNLDEIKARRARLEWDSNKSMYDAYWDKHHFNKYAPTDMDWLIAEVERLKAEKAQAEAERDVLAEALAWGAGKENRPIFDKLPWCDSRKKWLKYAQQQAEKKQSHIGFIRAELGTVNNILANLSENDVMGRMSFEGRKAKLESELQQAEKRGV